MRAQIAIAMSTDKTVMEAIVGEPSLDSPSNALPSSWEGSTDGVERGLLDMTGRALINAIGALVAQSVDPSGSALSAAGRQRK